MPPLKSDANNQKQPEDKFRAHEARLQLENKLRVKKSSILDRERRIHEISLDARALTEALRHVTEEEKRLSNEIRNTNLELKKEVGETKTAEAGLRETSQSLTRKQDAIRKLEHEIVLLKQQITEKEREIAEIKDETRDLQRDKEDFRRTGELEHFSMKTGEEHLHEKQVKLQLLTQDKLRKENELKHKEDMERAIHREVLMLQQEVSQMESELERIPRT